MTQSQVALPTDDEFYDGLEDLEPVRTIPRININQKRATFSDSQTNEEFPVLSGIMLGLIRQRVYWDKDVQEGAKPYCKSNNAIDGFPNIDGPNFSLFPWKASGIDRATLPLDEHGRPTMKCETCPHTQWGGTQAKRIPPACNERYTIPILYSVVEGVEPDRIGVISFQGAGITPLRHYMSAFKASKKPLFSAFTRVTLLLKNRGSVDYSVPTVSRLLGAVPEADWQNFASQFRAIREMLTEPPRPPRTDDEEEQGTPAQQPVVQAQVVMPPATKPAPAQQTSVVDAASPARVTVDDDDDLPF